MADVKMVLEDLKELLEIHLNPFVDDCTQEAIQTIRELQNKLNKRYEQDFEFDFSNCTSFNCQCGRHYINSSAKLQGKSDEVCEWTLMDEDFNAYDTSCRSTWCLESGNPSDNEMNYCPSCGKKIKVVE